MDMLRSIAWSQEFPIRARLYWQEGFMYLRSENKIEQAIGEEILSRCRHCQFNWEIQAKIKEIKQNITKLYYD